MNDHSHSRYAVIMAGGKGERFWPASRSNHPKHLLNLLDTETLLEATIARLETLMPTDHVFILTNREQIENIQKVCPHIPRENIIAEPVGRDTAPAAGLANLLVQDRDPEGVYALLPADHVIRDRRGFCELLETAFEEAEKQNQLHTIGIKPTEAATGYGYIKRGASIGSNAEHRLFGVEAFVEKPDHPTAEAYLQDESYYWNAGMFIWSVPAFTEALKQHAPELADGMVHIKEAWEQSGSLEHALETHFPSLPRISVDYAIMEKAGNVAMLESCFDWDDVGAWPALANHLPMDEQENTTLGQATILEGKRNLVVSNDHHLTALLGVDDLIVVHTEDATLVCPKESAQDIKKLVQHLGNHPPYKKYT